MAKTNKTVCEKQVKLELVDIGFKKYSLSCKGGELFYELQYRVTKKDEDCSETVEEGTYHNEIPLTVGPCVGERCCDGHFDAVVIEFKYNKETGEFNQLVAGEAIDEDKYAYCGAQMPVFIEPDVNNECGNDCKCKPLSSNTLYCVDVESVKVRYVTVENGQEVLSEKGIVPVTGGTVVVSFDYTWFVEEQDCDGNTREVSGKDTYTDRFDVPACDCNNEACGEIEIETSFKEAYLGGCNKFSYIINQETCLNK